MDALEAIMTTRAIRRYSYEPVTDDEIASADGDIYFVRTGGARCIVWVVDLAQRRAGRTGQLIMEWIVLPV